MTHLVTNNLLLLLLLISIQNDTIMAQISIKNPNGEYINFEVVDTASKLRIKQNEVDTLFRVERSLVTRNVYLLKNGDFLFEYTVDDYALRFKTQKDLSLFMTNQYYLTTSLIFEKNKQYYKYTLTSPYIKELMQQFKPTLIEGYPSSLNFKLYALPDGHFVRVSERAPYVYDGSWFPDFETFEWYYYNQYTD